MAQISYGDAKRLMLTPDLLRRYGRLPYLRDGVIGRLIRIKRRGCPPCLALVVDVVFVTPYQFEDEKIGSMLDVDVGTTRAVDGPSPANDGESPMPQPPAMSHTSALVPFHGVSNTAPTEDEWTAFLRNRGAQSRGYLPRSTIEVNELLQRFVTYVSHRELSQEDREALRKENARLDEQSVRAILARRQSFSHNRQAYETDVQRRSSTAELTRDSQELLESLPSLDRETQEYDDLLPRWRELTALESSVRQDEQAFNSFVENTHKEQNRLVLLTQRNRQSNTETQIRLERKRQRNATLSAAPKFEGLWIGDDDKREKAAAEYDQRINQRSTAKESGGGKKSNAPPPPPSLPPLVALSECAIRAGSERRAKLNFRGVCDISAVQSTLLALSQSQSFAEASQSTSI